MNAAFLLWLARMLGVPVSQLDIDAAELAEWLAFYQVGR